MRRCDATMPVRASEPAPLVVCPSPLLLFFFLLGIMGNATTMTRHDHPSFSFTLLSLDHEHTHTYRHRRVQNQIPTPPLLSLPSPRLSGSYLPNHTNRQNRFYYMPRPAPPRLFSRRVRRSAWQICLVGVHLRAAADISPGQSRRGYTSFIRIRGTYGEGGAVGKGFAPCALWDAVWLGFFLAMRCKICERKGGERDWHTRDDTHRFLAQ